VIFGTTVSGRSAPIKGLQDMVGLFINTIPLRIKTGIGETIKDLLCRVNDSLSIREKYESTPLVDIKEYSQVASHVDLFDSLVVMENYPLDQSLMRKDSRLPLVVESYSIVESTHYDLGISITIGEVIGIDFIYNPNSLEESNISRLSSHFNNIIEYILIDPGNEIFQIEMLSAEEKKQVLYDFNDTEAAYPQNKTIHGLFAGQAEKTPDHTALVGKEEGWKGRRVEGKQEGENSPRAKSQELRAITYKELNEQSHRLAYLLREKGVEADIIVGIMMERSVEMVIGILGILKAGGAYLPIAPDYPQERVDFMLKDSNAKILLKDNDLSTLPPFHHSPLPPFPPSNPTDLAYVIYTSGSTGQPKGVMVDHFSAVNLLSALHNKYPFRESDVYLLKTSYFFDVSVCELFGWFLGGGRLAVLEQNGEKDPQKILDTIENARVTHIDFVPSMFKVFTDVLNPQNIEKLSTLRYIFLAGETLLPQLISRFRRLNAAIVLENIYGPTEATVYASWYSLSLWSGDDIIPIGQPLPNVQLFILGCSLNLQPVGVPGELSTAGAGLARGYLNNPQLTSEKFINYQIQIQGNPGYYRSYKSHKSYNSYKSYVLYKTGDLARWLPDGNVEFLGRMDHQVKIRGLRIELEEIENQLLAHHQVKEAVVTARQDHVGDRYLAAYIVPASTELTDPDKMDELRRHLSLKLPGYMVPSHFVILERIPRTPSGKVDRKALPEPGITSKKAYVAPGTETEGILAGLWSEVLGIQREKISVNDNFFELGGHSLKVASLISRIHKAFDLEIPYSKFFKFPSIRGIVSYLREIETRIHQPIPPAEQKEYYPLNNTQKQFYVAQQVKHGDTSYNMNETMHMKGVLARERMESVFRHLLHRHESLRISFQLVGGEPVQKMNRDLSFNLEYYDAETTNKQELEKITRNFIRPFDLTRAPLWRVGLVKTASDEHLLMIDMNHLIADGTSIGIFIRDFNLIYNQEPQPMLNINYHDYLEWYRKRSEEVRKKSRTSPGSDGFEEFENEFLALPTDFPRPALPDFAGKTIKFDIGIDRVKALYDLSIEQDVTFYMVLLAVFNVLLAKLSNQETIAVGSPMAGRIHVDLDNLMGLFLNTICLRNRPEGEKQFLTFLQEIKERAVSTFDRQDFQYEELIARENLVWGLRRNPLYNVMLVLQNMEMPEINIPGLTITRQVGDYLTSKFDMTLYCEEKDPVVFKLEYSTALFKQDTIRRFIRYFKEIISRILENPHQEIADIEILPAEEKQQILYDFNDTRVEYPDDRCIYQLIEAQSRKTPDQIALVGVHETHEKHEKNHNLSPGSHLFHRSYRSYRSYISYKELNEKANRLARLLRAKGIQPDTIVGILLERSLLLVTAILAILKAGGAYLPLDPEYPGQRIISMLEHSRSSLILTQSSSMKEKPLPSASLSLEVVEIEEMEELIGKSAGLPGEDLEPGSGPGNLIYIIFTSGSTGIPKGAGVYHRGFVNLLHWFVTEFALNPQDRNLLLTSLSFDLTQKNLYASLITGGTLCVPGVGYFDPHSLVKQTREQGVTWINCTPSMFYQIVEYEEAYHYEGLSGLRWVFLGGEPIAMSFLLPWLESGTCRTEIVNTYGPTECTDICNFYRVRQPGRFVKEEVPLGKPVYNVQLYIVDRHLRLTSVGVAGELVIGGAGVGKGYINDKELTARKFITHSFDPGQPPQLLYKTGDLVKWLPDGNMVFLGRIDHQVKVRGFRIELGEIEKRLLDHDAVKEAAAVVREEKNHEKNLCAYIVLHPGASLHTAELLEYLSRELPGYMVPAYVVQLEKMPLNPNGKVDRKSLPEPERTTQKHVVHPQNRTENRLAAIWAQVLELDKTCISIDDNFFNLGGHSLKATTLVGHIYKELNVEIPLPEVFRAPTIRDLALYIDHREQSLYARIEPTERKEYYTLSSVQKRLYALWQLEASSIVYNISLAFLLEGHPGKHKLEEIFKELVHRHESLRTSFEVVDIEPVQRIHEEVKFEIENKEVEEGMEEGRVEGWKGRRVEEINACGEGKVECSPLNCQGRGEVSSPIEIETITREFIRPFDLSQAPLLRVGLIKLHHLPAVLRGYPSSIPPTPAALRSHPSQEGISILMVDMHHIISDGISSGILVKEFMALVGDETLPDLKLQYKDYSEWQKDEKQRKTLKKQENYWKRRFTDEIPVLDLPTDFPRPAVQAFDGSHVTFEIVKETAAALKFLALSEGTTLYMVLLAIYNIFLSKLSSQEDIIVGTPTAGRGHSDLEPIMGMFVNTLVLRNYPRSDRSFLAFLTGIKERTLEAFDHRDYPYEDLVDRVIAARNTSRNPLFDTMLVLQDTGIPVIRAAGLRLISLDYQASTAKFDLLLIAEEREEKLVCIFEYSTRLFTADTIQRFIGYFNKIVSTITGNTAVKLAEIEIISEEEKQQVLMDFNDTRREYPKDRTIHQLFAEQLGQTPDHTAAVGPLAIKNRTNRTYITYISYRELNNQSNRLAFLLQTRGVKPDTIVGIMLERSLEMIIGILAILKTGGAYMPIDPDYPEERKQYMLKDSGTEILLKDIDFHPSTLLPFYPSGPSNLAYIMYTSGSTGKPKGVMVEHRSVVRLVKNTDYVEFKENQGILQTGALEFDASTFEIWGALLNGLTLYLVDKGQILNPERLKDTIKKYHISTIWMTSPLFNQMVQADVEIFAGLTHLLVGGDALSPSHISRVKTRFPALKVINGYGPTENTTFSTTFLIDKEYNNIPIGSPIANSTAIIIDKNHHLQPVKVVGELCVGGDGVSRGYLNDPELTAEKFIENYFYRSYRSYRSNIKLYKTGDLARWLADGNIEFLGRIDHQVKLRGFRVEPGEIENRLLSHQAITDTVVLVKQHQNQEKYLCAYVVPNSGYSPAGTVSLEEELRKHLQQTLPNYMVPGYFIPLNRLPLTPNGKIDRKALPEPGAAGGAARENPIITPRNAIEEKLTLLWSEILSIRSSRLSMDSDFFQLGGHSLKALQVLNAVQKEFNVKLDFQDIFQNPTIAELGKLIRENRKTAGEIIENQPEKEYYRLSYAQKRLWLLYQLEPGNPAFNLPTRVTLYGRVEEAAVHKALEKLVQRHESFRTYFKPFKGRVVQRILSHLQVNLDTYDLSAWESQSRDEKRNRLFKEESLHPFNLETPPLFRLKLIKCGSEESDLIITMHHIITDGWSMEVLEREFTLLYEPYKTGRYYNLPALKNRYIDYVYWQEFLLADKEKMQGAREFWEKQLKGDHPILDLPYDFPKKNMETKESAAYGIVIPKEIMLILKKIAVEHKGSLFMVLLAGFNLLLYRITRQKDILLGVPGAARQHEDLKNIVGFFVNTLILRDKINPDESFFHFLLRVQGNALKVLEYQSFPLELLCSEFKIKYPEIPVFFNMSIFGNIIQEEVKCDSSYHIQTVQDAKFDIACYVGEYKNGITIETHYYKELFKPITIEKIMQLYRMILENIAMNPGKQVGEYRYSLTRQKRKLTFSTPAGVKRVEI
jgi:tyrocidine synthetase-3